MVYSHFRLSPGLHWHECLLYAPKCIRAGIDMGRLDTLTIGSGCVKVSDAIISSISQLPGLTLVPL